MEKYIIKETIIKIIRKFFYARKFHEIIPPILNDALPLEANLRPFQTEQYFLPMSPERGLKKMLAQGVGNCFAIAQSFRNYEQLGTLHFNEFIMLEWYRKGAIFTDIMNDTEQLLRMINGKMDKKLVLSEKHFPQVSLNNLFETKIGEKLEKLINNEKLLHQIARKKNYIVEKETTWDELYDQLFVNEIENTFTNEPFFLVDFPSRISRLCKRQKDNPHFAERFELYIHGIEIGNGNTENTDTGEIRKYFEIEHKKSGMPIDEDFLASLDKMKHDIYAGMGLGIERLSLLFENSDI